VHGIQSGATWNADVGHVGTHLTPNAAQPYACMIQAGFLHIEQ